MRIDGYLSNRPNIKLKNKLNIKEENRKLFRKFNL